MQNLKKLSSFIDVLIIIFAYIVTNSASFAFIWQFPDFTDFTEAAWYLVGVSFCLFLLMIINIRILELGKEMKEAWLSQIPLIFFVTYCVVSLFWSTYLLASINEAIQMLFATFIGVYIVVRYEPEKSFNIILYYGIFSIIVSSLLLIFDPSLARINNAYFQGAWRGIYWHRNHLGSLMAFFSAILIVGMVLKKGQARYITAYMVIFFMSSILVFGSRSATGILIYFILNGFLVIAFLWIKFHNRLKREHYLGLSALFGIVLVLILSDLDRFFGLVGRNSTLTGRVPLWIDLVTRVWLQKSIFGYGFGALWNQEVFREALTLRHGWGYMIYFSDNGYLDLLLNTGLIGLILFLVFFGITGKRSICAFIKRESFLSIVPLLLFAYVFLANISYSFLFEVDQFVWMLLVFSAILSFRMLNSKTIPESSKSNPQP
jgi:exopolysaccharide production protein ExoQ